MKNLIVILMFLVSFSLCYGQTSSNVKAKTATQTEQSLTKTATKTTYVYKGKPVFKSSKGSYFVVMISKKTGNPYKLYVTI